MVRLEDERIYPTTYTVASLEKVPATTAVREMDMPLHGPSASESQATISSEAEESNRAPATTHFKNYATNFLFVVSISLTQVLGEYLISGYSVLLPSLLDDFSDAKASRVWLASSLTIVSASTTLPLSRIVDMHGGYSVFLAGASLVLTWSIVCAFATSPAVFILCRAMQGLGIAALQPAVFSLIGTRYPAGKQRNIALGMCGAASPLGFFLGVATSGLAVTHATWRTYFFVPAAMSLLSMALMHASAPAQSQPGASRRARVQMDWLGAMTMLAGLFSIMYALAAASLPQNRWQSPQFAVPFSLGVLSLVLFAFIEARRPACALLPPDFFAPKYLPTFCFAALFFYATFGVFLYYSPLYMDRMMHASALEMVLWNIPFAAGGCILACLGGFVFHAVPITYFLLLSGAAWILAPLMFVIASPAAPYWDFVFPSMVCATVGIDITYTVSTVFFSTVQPEQYQGLAGSMCSVLLYIGMSFSVGIAEVVRTVMVAGGSSELDSYRAAFVYAATSAAIGFVICAVGVRIPKVNGPLSTPP